MDALVAALEEIRAGRARRVFWISGAAAVDRPGRKTRDIVTRLSIVVPVYNSAATLSGLHARITQALDGLQYELGSGPCLPRNPDERIPVAVWCSVYPIVA